MQTPHMPQSTTSSGGQDPWTAWRVVATNGVELHYVEQGAGAPVILVHGNGATDARAWEAQLAPFAERYRFVAYSRRYYHPNAWVAGVPGLDSTQTHANDLYGLIRTLDFAPVHLVASSYGGDIALLVALQHPEVVRSLVLGEPGLAHWLLQLADGPELATSRARLWATFQPAAQRGDLEVAAHRYARVALGVSRFDVLPASTRQRVLDNARLLGAEQAPPPELATFSREEARRVRTPTLLLTGDHSPDRFLRVAEELAQCIPHAERAVIPGADHLLHAMNPRAYNQTVLAYLGRQEEASPL